MSIFLNLSAAKHTAPYQRLDITQQLRCKAMTICTEMELRESFTIANADW